MSFLQYILIVSALKMSLIYLIICMIMNPSGRYLLTCQSIVFMQLYLRILSLLYFPGRSPAELCGSSNSLRGPDLTSAARQGICAGTAAAMHAQAAGWESGRG